MRSAAPIIIHINLDKVLQFLVKDTHYRNQFETGTSGGSTDLKARRSWEVRIHEKRKALHSLGGVLLQRSLGHKLESFKFED